MKLFVIAALIAVAAAGRLEHLERSYLPPDNSIGVARSGVQGYNAGGNFAGATSNQYLPPDYEASGNSGSSQYPGSLQGLGGQPNYRSQQQSGYQQPQGDDGYQYSAPRIPFGSPQAGSSFGSPQAGSTFGSPQTGSTFGSLPAGRSYGYPQAGSTFGSLPAGRSYGSPQVGSSFGSPSYQQNAATSRQYLAPQAGSRQQYPQQAFDEQTGYIY
ncbi:hypothetical protein PYW08_005424 [Mythimna loreyi]|uniref:Uncharacterized protein n=1 Tax=Mythimna loreyi TaxID=667449 RepID=A0ACC2QH58_9NEOP|nr:hypothetical protein PYW08_005424 [Mythimna loreyi]